MQDSSILVVGESLMDIVHRADAAKFYPGGSPMNVAVGLGRLGGRVRLLTRIGRDALGEQILSHLQAAGVEVCAGSIVDAATSTAVARIDDGGAASYEFNIKWALPPAVVVGTPMIVHVGSIGSILQPGASVVRQVLESSADAIITFDPNMRPSLIDNHPAAVTAIEELVRLVDVVKLSDEDAAWLYPRLSPTQALAQLTEMGPSLVIMTQGAAGATLRTQEEHLQLAAFPATVVDTVGAGDSFMTGVIDSILSNDLTNAIRDRKVTSEDLQIIGSEALACAAVTVSRNGALPPTRAELEEVANGNRK